MNKTSSKSGDMDDIDLQQKLSLSPITNDDGYMTKCFSAESGLNSLTDNQCRKIITHPTMFSSEKTISHAKKSLQGLKTLENQPKNEMKKNPPEHWTLQYPRAYLLEPLHRHKEYAVYVGERILKSLPEVLRAWVTEHTPNVRLAHTPVPWRPSKTELAFRLTVDRKLYHECIEIVMSHGKITKSQAVEIIQSVALNLLKSQLSKQVWLEVSRHVENICHAFE